jgi:hypothetical protein
MRPKSSGSQRTAHRTSGGALGDGFVTSVALSEWRFGARDSSDGIAGSVDRSEERSSELKGVERAQRFLQLVGG